MDQETKIQLFEPSPNALGKRRARDLALHEMEEVQEVPDLVEYWWAIRKRRATILTTVFIVFAVGLFATLKQKPVYKARALIEIQKENPDVPTLQELFQVENISDTYLETQYRILKSENLARRVIAQLRLEQVAEFGMPIENSSGSQTLAVNLPHAIAGDPPRTHETSSEVLKKFQERLDVEPLKRSRLVEVTFESHDAKLAAQVVNSLASAYIEQNLDARWEASQKASEWLSQQLLDMKAQLEKSEDELQKYARENGLLFLETDKGTTENIVAQRLRQLQEELTKAQADRYAKESFYRLVQEGDFASIPGVFDDKMMQDLTEKLAELERERSRLITNFNADYPRV
jgi:succinoglycan biosynthesis transport protein ExoP